MTEAELFEAFIALGNTHLTLFFGYISLLSGFLIMSYLVAHRLSATLASIVLVLFTVVTATLIFRMNLVRNNTEALMSHIVEEKALNNIDLPWFPLFPPGYFILSLEIFATLGGFVGCLIFFFYQRKAGSRVA